MTGCHHEGISLRQLIRQPITPPRSECRILVEKMLNDSERGRDGLIAHGASIVPLMRGFGGSLGHVVGYHVECGAKRSADVAELNVMAKHMHAHVDVPGRGFVRRMKPHGNGALIDHVNVGGGEDHQNQGARGACVG